MPPAHDLHRFVQAQESATAGQRAALAELRAGAKRGHWIWYVFPQLAGLGRSSTAQRFGLTGLEEATDYVRHPALGERLLAAGRVVAEQLEAGVALETLMGSDIDALKLVSSMTLFERVASRLNAVEPQPLQRDLASTARQILDRSAAQGYPACQFTLAACVG